MQKQIAISKGTVTEVDEHPEYGRAEVALTVVCDDGVEFHDNFDEWLNTGRAAQLRYHYGKRPSEAHGLEVNVYHGENHRHILLSLPLVRLDGGVLVSRDDRLPVEMS